MVEASEEVSEAEARESRRRELRRKSKRELAGMCSAGITRRSGGVSYVEGGYAPVIKWEKDEIVQSILNAEFG